MFALALHWKFSSASPSADLQELRFPTTPLLCLHSTGCGFDWEWPQHMRSFISIRFGPNGWIADISPQSRKWLTFFAGGAHPAEVSNGAVLTSPSSVSSLGSFVMSVDRISLFRWAWEAPRYRASLSGGYVFRFFYFTSSFYTCFAYFFSIFPKVCMLCIFFTFCFFFLGSKWHTSSDSPIRKIFDAHRHSGF